MTTEYLHKTHQDQEDSSQGRPAVCLHIEAGKDDDGEDDRDEGVDEVPRVRRQPIAAHTHPAHKLQVLGLWGVGGHSNPTDEKNCTLDSFSATRKSTKLDRRKL